MDLACSRARQGSWRATTSPPSTRATSTWASSDTSCYGKAPRRFRSDSFPSEMTDPETVMARCDELAAFTEEPGVITRPYAPDSLRHAQERARESMGQSGMT